MPFVNIVHRLQTSSRNVTHNSLTRGEGAGGEISPEWGLKISCCEHKWLFQSNILEMAEHLHDFPPPKPFCTLFIKFIPHWNFVSLALLSLFFQWGIKAWGSYVACPLKKPGVSEHISWCFPRGMSGWGLRVSTSPPHRPRQASLSLVQLLTKSCRNALRVGCHID